jgi:hypothetical protein
MMYSRLRRTAAAALVVLLSVTAAPVVHANPADAPVVVAQEQGTVQGELRPRYEPVQPEPKSSYNNQYLFGMTRGVAQSTIHPAAKVPLFVLTIPLDIVFLPFAAIGGFFG